MPAATDIYPISHCFYSVSQFVFKPFPCTRPECHSRERWTVERVVAWVQNYRRLCMPWEKSTQAVQGYLRLGCALLLVAKVLGELLVNFRLLESLEETGRS